MTRDDKRILHFVIETLECYLSGGDVSGRLEELKVGNMRLCYKCKNFKVITASPEEGESWEMSCKKEIWKFDPREDKETTLGVLLEKARTCSDYIAWG